MGFFSAYDERLCRFRWFTGTKNLLERFMREGWKVEFCVEGWLLS